MTEQEYLEDNIATVAFHLGQPGARLSIQHDKSGLVVDPGEVLKEISRRLAVNSHDALRLLADLFAESAHETWTREEIVSIIEDAIRLGANGVVGKLPDQPSTVNRESEA